MKSMLKVLANVFMYSDVVYAVFVIFLVGMGLAVIHIVCGAMVDVLTP